MKYVGTVQGLRDYLHGKTLVMLGTKEYRDNPFEVGTLDYQDYEKFKDDFEANEEKKFATMHQGDNWEPSA